MFHTKNNLSFRYNRLSSSEELFRPDKAVSPSTYHVSNAGVVRKPWVNIILAGILMWMPVQVLAGNFYIDGVAGNDGNNGSSSAPWRTLGKAWSTLTGNNVSHTVHVASGNYFDEGNGNILGGAQTGSTITFIGENGPVEVRISAQATFDYAFTSTGTGTTVFRSITFNQALLGDGSGNINNKYFFYNNANSTLVFEDVEAFGGTHFVGGTAPAGSNLTFRRCRLHDFSSYVSYFRGNNLIVEASFISNVDRFLTTINGTNIANVILSNNTFYNTPVLDSGSVSYQNLQVRNNIVYGDTAEISLRNINTSYSVSNNIIYRTNMPSPRTSLGYGRISLTGAAIPADFIQGSTTYSFDPALDVNNLPALQSTSLAIGRGVDAGVSAGINGVNFDNSALPTIGAWAPSGGAKQVITPVPNKVMIVGDSITYGQTVVSGSRYTDLLEADSDLAGYTFVHMPGAPDRHLGIPGAHSDTIHLMAQEFAVASAPSIAIIMVGVNDLNSGKSTNQVTQQITATLEALQDIGVPLLIYGGTNIQSADASTPDVAMANSVESAVTMYCEGAGCRAARVSHKMQKVGGWNSDSSGLYSVDDLHPNASGHALMAEVIKPQILAAYTVNADNASFNYTLVTPVQGDRYGLVVAGDNVTLDNVTVADFSGDGILIQGDNATVRNTLVAGNGGNAVNMALTGASLSLAQSNNLIDGPVNGFIVSQDTISGDPLFVGGGDYSLQAVSPAVDVGAALGFSQDSRGNPLCGTPDIGALEYQPPFTMSIDKIDTSANVRIYMDGKFRSTLTPGGLFADLSVQPATGWISNSFQLYVDLVIQVWDYGGLNNKLLEFIPSVADTSIITIGDMKPNTGYVVQVDSTDYMSTQTDFNGQLSFTISHGASGSQIFGTVDASVGNDTDGDRLSDVFERCYDGNCLGYDPYDVSNPTGGDLNINKADTDNDGYSDKFEITYGSAPLDAASQPIIPDGDINMDGVINAADILLANRYVLGLATLSSTQIEHGDQYPPPAGDGQLTTSDIVLITRQALTLP